MDVICQAKSGMGKTAVFVISTLQQLDPVDGEVSVIVLCHTRELAFQIAHEYERFTTYLKNVRVANFFGGMPLKQQRDLLKDKEKSPHILIGTPGRIKAVSLSCAAWRGGGGGETVSWLLFCGGGVFARRWDGHGSARSVQRGRPPPPFPRHAAPLSVPGG